MASNNKKRRVSAEVVHITPVAARRWLDESEHKNRAITRERVLRYRRLMREGLWRLNGESIIFDDENNLLNGRHRLTAAAEEKVGFPSIVVRGIEPEAFDTMDQGKNRSLSDMISIEGRHHTTIQAGAARVVYALANNATSTHTRSLSDRELLAYWRTLTNDGFDLWVPPRFARKQLAPPTMVMGVGYWISRNNDPEVVREFLNRLMLGYDLKSSSPILKLRSALLDENIRAIDRVRRDNLIEQTIRVWNAMDADNPVPYDQSKKKGTAPFTQPQAIKVIKW